MHYYKANVHVWKDNKNTNIILILLFLSPKDHSATLTIVCDCMTGNQVILRIGKVKTLRTIMWN